ncbi:polyadenylate-binding protein-interacting protein 1 [Mytilus galloprovincialis]|uniref:Polyadenylate-binding protein-interacting protein 1 n=1 Tax=Mytilus galloprovincialis TaxID=29158 RepID=A0A8B6FVS7_MYTGA|nr:polyadenylate-binding protein-interacting protein 1 [Mytilus galloprovincialis]
MQVVHGGQPHKIAVLRIVIKDLLLLLLEHSTNGTVTCATQILKRAGAVIEQTGYLNKPEEGNFSEVFSQLRQLLDKGRLNQTTRASITSLLDLKSHNWVRRDSSQHHPVSTRVDYEEVYQDRMRHTDSRILENNENAYEVQQLEENEDSQSSMQGAEGYTSKLLAEPLIAKGIYLCCFLSA